MATLWIREYTELASAGVRHADGAARFGEGAPIPKEPGTDQTPVTFSTSTQSAAFGAATKFVTIYGSAAFHFVVGVDPTATTSALKMPSDIPITIGVTAGQKLAVIAAA